MDIRIFYILTVLVVISSTSPFVQGSSLISVQTDKNAYEYGDTILISGNVSTLIGDTQVTLQLRNYPNSSQASSPLGPFTITSSTEKVDTRARARAMSLKIANTAANQSWKLGTFRLDTQPDGRR